MEASPTPERAEASADRLGALMPAAGHMVHMPAHIYLRVGRYADAAEANVRAIAADEDYLAQCQAQGLYPVSYYPHNLHFLWAAATLEGRSAVAIDAARQVAAKVPHHHAGALAWTADFPVTPWLAYVRFGQLAADADRAAAAGRPSRTRRASGTTAAAWPSWRADQIERAEAELAALTAVMTHEAFSTTLKDLPLLTNLQIASRIVEGELAGQAGRHDEAVGCLREAVAIEDAIPVQRAAGLASADAAGAGRAAARGRAAERGRGGLSRGPEALPRERLVAVRSVAQPRGAGQGRRGARRCGHASSKAWARADIDADVVQDYGRRATRPVEKRSPSARTRQSWVW